MPGIDYAALAEQARQTAAAPPREITALAPAQEQAFRGWAARNQITDVDAPESHYDYRGYFQEHGAKPIRFGTDHFTDTYKQHGHPTFSEESKYSTGPGDGGRWTGKDGETFVPGKAAGAVDYAALAQQARQPAAAAAPPPDPNVDAHGNRTVRNPDGSVKFIQGPGFRGDLEGRPDSNMLTVGDVGLAPETALMGVQAGRAILKPGLALAGRVGEAAAHVAPVVKYEIAKHTLTALGLPDSVATVAAIAVSGYKKGGGAKAAETEAVTPAATSGRLSPQSAATVTPQASTVTPQATAIAPVASHTPAPPLRNLNDVPAVAVTPAQAAAERVLQFNPSKVLAEVKDTFTKVGETPLRGEATNAMEYMRRGVPAEDAVARVIARRTPTSAVEDLAARLGGPKDAVVKARVASRNSSGRWTE